LEFDLQSSEDYTSGQKQNRTDLNVGLSKTLLNDRLKVTVGSNFGLEGAQQANQEANNIAGDISADYQLSKDGRYKLRAYRKNQYQVALQGQVVETGVAFTITINYNKFRELFHRPKNENQSKKSKKKPNE
ncbi:MAG TPA: translocation/assembly module TamB domain-containing protein, partial [Flavobacterium sp.]